MSRTYRFRFSPLTPYFFGNEKSYCICNMGSRSESSYYLKGEDMPLQTTVFGALRYICIPEKRADMRDYPAGYLARHIGAGGFNIDADGRADFGMIKNMSAVYVTDSSGRHYVPTPANHVVGKDRYTPFTLEKLGDDNDGRLYASDFNVKDGTADSFMCVETGEIIPRGDIFGRNTRVGNNRSVGADGFFKREFVTLADGYAFEVAAEIDAVDGFSPVGTHTVFMGQCKSAFSVTVTEWDGTDVAAEVGKLLPDGMCYLMSDTFLAEDVKAKDFLCGCLFAVTGTRDYRPFFSNNYKRGDKLYKMLSAGSVFIPRDSNVTGKLRRESAEQIGFNKIITR